jgi:hypothetical protein
MHEKVTAEKTKVEKKQVEKTRCSVTLTEEFFMVLYDEQETLIVKT